jgi:hypothetical protein
MQIEADPNCCWQASLALQAAEHCPFMTPSSSRHVVPLRHSWVLLHAPPRCLASCARVASLYVRAPITNRHELSKSHRPMINLPSV